LDDSLCLQAHEDVSVINLIYGPTAESQPEAAALQFLLGKDSQSWKVWAGAFQKQLSAIGVQAWQCCLTVFVKKVWHFMH